MAKKSRISSFRGKTSANTASRKRGSGFSYLSLPNGVEMFVPEPDEKYTIDFMPYEVSDKHHPDRDERNEIAIEGSYWYKRPFHNHKNVGVKNEKVICPQSFGKPCPICDYRAELRKKNGDEDEIKELNTSNRNLYPVIIRGHKKFEDGKVYLFDFSDYLFQEKFEQQLQDDERFDVFPDHAEGCSVKVIFAEESFAGNKYASPTRFDFVNRKEQYDDSILDEIPKLDECFVVLSYEQLKAKFFEAAIADDEEDEDEDEKPKRKTSAPTKKAAVVVEEEEEEEEEDEEPVQKRKAKTVKAEEPAKRSRKAVVEEEEEDEDEEEVPVAKKSTKKEVAEKPASGKCPHNHTFGKDNDEHDECDECPLWNPCYKASKV